MSKSQICGTWQTPLSSVQISCENYGIYTVVTRPFGNRQEVEHQEAEEIVKSLQEQGYEKA